MPTEITSISAGNNPVAQTRQPQAAPAVGRQSAVANGQALPPDQSTQQATSSQGNNGQQAEIDRAVSDINSYVQTVNRELQFSVEEELSLGRAIIKVVDAETDEVIREIPSEDVLELAKRLDEFNESIAGDEQLKGLIIQAQA